MNYPKKVRLVEVGPRDGLQNEAKPVPVEAKVTLIDALSAAGHSAVEAGSFVSPKWVPQMANTDQVMAQVEMQCGPHRVVSLMSTEAVRELGLVPGVLAVAVVKSTQVMVEIPGGRE